MDCLRRLQLGGGEGESVLSPLDGDGRGCFTPMRIEQRAARRRAVDARTSKHRKCEGSEIGGVAAIKLQ